MFWWSVLNQQHAIVLFRPIMGDVLLSCFSMLSLLWKNKATIYICNHQFTAAYITLYIFFFFFFAHPDFLMVLTINREYLCFNHPPVIICTDLIFLYHFFLQSRAGKTWLQNGDVIAFHLLRWRLIWTFIFEYKLSDCTSPGLVCGFWCLSSSFLTIWIKNKTICWKWYLWVFH